jgi:hypothetical protein
MQFSLLRNRFYYGPQLLLWWSFVTISLGPCFTGMCSIFSEEPVYLFPYNNPLRYVQSNWRSKKKTVSSYNHRTMRCLRTVNAVSLRPYLLVSAADLTLSYVSITSYVGRSRDISRHKSGVKFAVYVFPNPFLRIAI